MIPDWETDTVLISDGLSTKLPNIAARLESVLREHRLPLLTVCGMADIWIRDAAPIQVNRQEFVQFRYRPDYLCNGYEHLITGPEVFQRLDFIEGARLSGLIIDGGNIVATRTTAIVTDKIYRENPSIHRPQLREELAALLGNIPLIVIRKEPYDKIGHADGMVRFITDKRVVLNDYSQIEPALFEDLQHKLTHAGLEIVLVPYVPDVHAQNDIPSAVGNYANFLRVGNLILVPAYGLVEDEAARTILANQLPEAIVVSFPCRELAEEGGVLNCASWTIQLSVS